MTPLRTVLAALVVSLPGLAAAADFDGSVPLSCNVEKAHDCLPTARTCSPLKAESDIAPVFAIDFTKKEVRSPYRTALLTVLHTSTTDLSMVLQGADLRFAWSAMVDKKTGALIVSVADAKGSYVAFGQCKVATPR